MKKIININLSGRVIPIEDTAYEKLQVYIESLRRYFAKEEGRDEIINDIESRIAELMNDKVRKGASAVTDADIQEIIASMGTPEDFDADATQHKDSTTSESSPNNSFQTGRKRSRLYRDANDKFIGGVCSGIAAYMNIDPAIIRILFAIITFGGFGLGFLIYILLWIVLPVNDLEGYKGKRLYRNPEDKMIGGVAGGLAAYLNRDAKVIRLIFAAPFLLSALFAIFHGFRWDFDFDLFSNLVFGSISSTFALVYLILWMVLPEANSPYEKMEMRGEKVDVNTIRQNVKDEMGNMKDRVKNWSDEVKTSAQQFSNKARDFANTRGKSFASEFNQTAQRSGRGIGHAIGVLFKAFFYFIAGTIAFSIFVALIALLFGGIAWWPINNFLWTSKWQQFYAWGTLIFFFIIPLIAFITWLVRRILKVRSRNSYLGWTFGFLWTIGWIAAILLAASITKDFQYKQSVRVPVTIQQPANNKMIVVVSDPEIGYNGNFSWIGNHDDFGDAGWDLTEDSLKLSAVDFSFVKSIDADYHVNIIKKSFGRANGDAAQRASQINYSIASKDSVLDLASGFAIGKQSKFRIQHVQVEIQIPPGKQIRFDGSVRRKLHGFDIDVRATRRWSRDGDVYIHKSFYLDSNVDYTMDNNGELVSNEPKSSSVTDEDKSSDFRYHADEKEKRISDSIIKQRRYEQKKAELDEMEKEMKKKPVTKSTTTDNESSIASYRSPALGSLVAWF